MRIAISGMGHVGTWLARELCRDNTVAVYDKNREKPGSFEGLVVFSRPSDLKDFGPDIFINAVSLVNTLGAFEESLPYLPKDCIICDVASIKSGIQDYYKKSPFRFVSIHPMFGPTFARMDSLEEENVLIMNESDGEGAGFFREFFAALGIRTFEYSFQEHDRMMAYSLTLPFISSLVFAACVDTQTVPGTTFRKHITIAKGLLSEADSLLTEILFNSYSIVQIEKAASRLEFLKHVIMGKDHEELVYFFEKLRKNIS